MSTQTKEYLQEMHDMYLSIMKKVAGLGDLTTTDMLFLELYEKTIKKGYFTVGAQYRGI